MSSNYNRETERVIGQTKDILPVVDRSKGSIWILDRDTDLVPSGLFYKLAFMYKAFGPSLLPRYTRRHPPNFRGQEWTVKKGKLAQGRGP